MHPREQQPAAFRLVAADELGLLKRAWHRSIPAVECGAAAFTSHASAAAASSVHHIVNLKANTSTHLCPAVIEVPAGPKWGEADMVAKWCGLVLLLNCECGGCVHRT